MPRRVQRRAVACQADAHARLSYQIGVGWVALAVNDSPVDASNLMEKLNQAKDGGSPFTVTFREPTWNQVGVHIDTRMESA